jgi:hypothetical protein
MKELLETFTGPILTSSNRFLDQAGSPSPGGPLNAAASLETYYRSTNEAFRIFHMWSAEYIGLAPPSMVCIVVGPAAMFLRVARHLDQKERTREDVAQARIREKLLTLVLTHFARYWKIGSLLLSTSF